MKNERYIFYISLLLYYKGEIIMSKKTRVSDKMIPVSQFTFAKEKNGSIIRYFGIPVIVDLSKKKNEQFLTVGGIDTRKLVSILWINSPNSVSDETAAWQKNVLKIDIENEGDIDHPVILVDDRLLKFHIFGLSKKKIRAIIAFYSAKAMMSMADGGLRLVEYLETVADENSARAMFKHIEEASDDALEYVSEADTLALQLLLAASEVDVLPKHIQKSVAKNESKIGKFATHQFKIGRRELKKVLKAEKKAAKSTAKINEMKADSKTDDSEPSDDDLMEDQENNTDSNLKKDLNQRVDEINKKLDESDPKYSESEDEEIVNVKNTKDAKKK